MIRVTCREVLRSLAMVDTSIGASAETMKERVLPHRTRHTKAIEEGGPLRHVERVLPIRHTWSLQCPSSEQKQIEMLDETYHRPRRLSRLRLLSTCRQRGRNYRCKESESMKLATWPPSQRWRSLRKSQLQETVPVQEAEVFRGARPLDQPMQGVP